MKLPAEWDALLPLLTFHPAAGGLMAGAEYEGAEYEGAGLDAGAEYEGDGLDTW